jgi:hypothetical protein
MIFVKAVRFVPYDLASIMKSAFRTSDVLKSVRRLFIVVYLFNRRTICIVKVPRITIEYYLTVGNNSSSILKRNDTSVFNDQNTHHSLQRTRRIELLKFFMHEWIYIKTVSDSIRPTYLKNLSYSSLFQIGAQDKPSFADAIRDTPATVVEALICFFSIWSVLGLWGYHTYLICRSVTTNEDVSFK